MVSMNHVIARDHCIQVIAFTKSGVHTAHPPAHQGDNNMPSACNFVIFEKQVKIKNIEEQFLV